MAVNEYDFNPAFSTIKEIILTSFNNTGSVNDLKYLIISEQNTICRFERLEMVENVNEACPTGAILVADLGDIVSHIANNNLQQIIIKFLDESYWLFDITSISYSNNAVTVGDDTLVTIHFSNIWYKKFSSNSLNDLLPFKRPRVYKINDFVDDLKAFAFELPPISDEEEADIPYTKKPYNDPSKNYFLYKPFNPYSVGDESVSDDVFQTLNYVSSMAIDDDFNPNFFFWTSLDGSVNFKSFKRDVTKDGSYASIDNDFRRIGVYNGDAGLQQLSDRNYYRKAYFLATNPALQWLSKNYYYIRKTPKYLDEVVGLSGGTVQLLSGICAATDKIQKLKNLTFHFQDDGEKYNIDVITYEGRGGLTGAPKGGQALFPEHSWGYYDKTIPANGKSITNLNNNQFGVDLNYKNMALMGKTGYMPYLDSPDMWKNMFNLTPIHPNYPDKTETANAVPISGLDTNLQKVIQLRHKVFEKAGITGASGDNLELMRKIERQNFVLYSLCCMGKKEDCFFAMLTKYEEDTSITQTTTNSKNPKKYRYKWNKLNFGGASGPSGYCDCGLTSGSSNISGSCGMTGAHILENWCLDSVIRSSDKQDDTWAINVNERGITMGSSTYLPPGWLMPSGDNGFYYRPIGAKISPPATGSGDSGGEYIHHIVRMCKERIDARNTIYYFSAENIVDGTCSP